MKKMIVFLTVLWTVSVSGCWEEPSQPLPTCQQVTKYPNLYRCDLDDDIVCVSYRGHGIVSYRGHGISCLHLPGSARRHGPTANESSDGGQ
mgnify:CR=1 FL=1